MKVFSRDDLKTVLQKPEGLGVSLFMPTFRAGKETEQNPIRLKNLLGKAEEALIARGLRAGEARDFLGPAQRLVTDTFFWRNQQDGLAMFISSEAFHQYHSPDRLEETVVVNDRFYIKPLLPLLSGDGRFYILALSQKEISLFHCTGKTITELELEGVPKSMDEALGYDRRQDQLQYHNTTSSVGGRASPVSRAHGGIVDDKKVDLVSYFQHVDRGLQNLLRDQTIPLVLAGVEYILPIYKDCNSYSYLMEKGITGNPDGVSAKELHEQAWKLVQPYFHKKQEDAVARYNELAGTGVAASNIEEIVPAAIHGRVDFMFVALGVQRWGRYDAENNRVRLDAKQEPGDQDLLDLAAAWTLINSGMVYAVEEQNVPGTDSVAAVFRY